MAIINGGATLWARQTIESDIFYWKPAVWFKIWFYIICKVSHKDTKQFKRGQGLFNYKVDGKNIKGATPDQWKKCIKWLKSSTMISTNRSTRGNIITVLNYDLYQSMSNYGGTTKSTKVGTLQAPSRHQAGTPIYKNEKNEKNNTSSATNFSSVRDTLKWQALAFDILGFLTDAKERNKESSVYRSCKEDERASRFAFDECKELGKPDVLYFLKLYNKYSKSM